MTGSRATRKGASRTAHPGEAHLTTLERIAYFRGRRDEVPNQELAHALARTRDRKGIKEIAENLWHKNKRVRSDCLKVLYEIGYIEPALIAGHVDDFLKLLGDKDNRMVWGAMIALACVADKRAKEVWPQIDDIIRITDGGTVITVVWGIRTMARVAAASSRYRAKLFPVLLGYLRRCIPRDLPTHAESMRCAVGRGNRAQFLSVLSRRQEELTASQQARLRKVLKSV